MNELPGILARIAEIDDLLCLPETQRSSSSIRALSSERAALSRIRDALVALASAGKLEEELEEALSGNDPELAEMARDELPGVRAQRAALEDSLKRMLLPRDENGPGEGTPLPRARVQTTVPGRRTAFFGTMTIPSRTHQPSSSSREATW